MTTTPGATQEPNLYQLEGDGLTVTYSTSSIDGQPQLVYQTAEAAQSFRGTEIRVAETELGTLVSVSLMRSVDVGYTGFTLVVPEISLAGAGTVAVRTIGLTVVHRVLAGAIGHPQRTTYKVTRLRGSASQVDF